MRDWWLMAEIGILQDAIDESEDMTDVLLRSCLEGVRFVHQAMSDLSSTTLPLLNVKSNEQKLIT